MKNLRFVGKIMYAGTMGVFGIFHLMNADAMTGAVPDFLPFPVLWVYITGIALLLAAISIIIGKMSKLATRLLGLMLLLFAILVHMKGFFEGNQVASGMFLKDLALAGAAFFMSTHTSD